MEGLIEVIIKRKMTFDMQVKRFVLTILPMMLAIMLMLYSQVQVPWHAKQHV